MEAIKKTMCGDKVIEIYNDEDPRNPREDDCLDTMICFSKRYVLGDKHNYKHEDFNGWDEMEEQIIKDHNPVVIKPLYLYDHSGITIATTPFSCPWDSGCVGFVLISRKSALENWSAKKVTKSLKDKAEKYVDAVVETYDQYLRGDCYGYVIKDKDGNELESCWGFFGMEYCEQEAEAMAKACKVKVKEDSRQLQLL